jgi:ketosteroid isomerase-like protein
VPPSLPECVRALGEAWAERDVARLRSMLAPGYIHTDFQGRVFRRDEWLAYAGSQGHGTAITFRDLEIVEHGSVGIVTGANDIAGGSEGQSTIRFTQVWAQPNGEWKRLAFQATLVRASADPILHRSLNP